MLFRGVICADVATSVEKKGVNLVHPITYTQTHTQRKRWFGAQFVVWHRAKNEIGIIIYKLWRGAFTTLGDDYQVPNNQRNIKKKMLKQTKNTRNTKLRFNAVYVKWAATY